MLLDAGSSSSGSNPTNNKESTPVADITALKALPAPKDGEVRQLLSTLIGAKPKATFYVFNNLATQGTPSDDGTAGRWTEVVDASVYVTTTKLNTELAKKESKLNSNTFKAIGSENSIGVNSSDDTLQKLAQKINDFTITIPKVLKGVTLADTSNLTALQAKEPTVTVNDLLFEFKAKSTTSSYIVVPLDKFVDISAIKGIKWKAIGGSSDQYKLTLTSISGGSIYLDMSRLIPKQGTFSHLVAGGDTKANTWSAKTIKDGINTIVEAPKFWRDTEVSYGDGSAGLNRYDLRLAVDPDDLLTYKAIVGNVPNNKQPKDNPTYWKPLVGSNEERSISVTYATLGATVASKLPSGETVLQFLQKPLVPNDQPRTLTTRLRADITLADFKSALGGTIGKVDYIDNDGVLSQDPTVIPKGFYQIINQDILGEYWLVESIGGSSKATTANYFDGGNEAQVNYDPLGWHKLELDPNQSQMVGFTLADNTLTCTVAGKYKVSTSVSIGDVANQQRGNGNGKVEIVIQVNGAFTHSTGRGDITTNSRSSVISTSGIVDLAVGDTLSTAIGAYTSNVYTRNSKLVVTPVASVVEAKTATEVDYQLVEQITGNKWIDGKPIYKTTIKSSIASDESPLNVPLVLDTIVDYKGVVKGADGSMIPLPFSDATQSVRFYYYQGKLVFKNTWGTPSSLTLLCTVYYTK